MEQLTPGSGSTKCATATVFRYGPTGLDMKDSGVRTKLMARASSTMLTEIYTKANGLTIRPKATVATRMQMEPTMKDSGTTTNNTATELNPGQTEPVTMERTSRAERRIEVASRSQTGATTRVSSTPMR